MLNVNYEFFVQVVSGGEQICPYEIISALYFSQSCMVGSWRNLNISIHSFSNPYRCIFAQKKVQT